MPRTRENNPMCKEYYIKRGKTEEEAKFELLKRNSGKIEYYLYYKNMNLEDAKKALEDHSKKIAMTKENMIQRYGINIGTQKWNSYCKKQSLKNTFEFKQKKYGWTKDKFDTFNKSRAVTLKNMVRKHGEEIGKIKFEKYCDRQGYTNTLEYFQEIYGKEDGKIKYDRINFLKGHSYESYLERFNGNEKEAKDAFNKYLESMSKRFNDSKLSYSFISIELFDSINIILKNKNIFSAKYVSHNGEHLIKIDTNKVYLLDFYLPEKKKCIEFFGDYWHCNPKVYKSGELVKFPHGTFSVDSIWERDKIRLEYMKTNKEIKDCLIIWEHDYLTDKNKTIQQCVDFLEQE